jgi:hypothetical protein
MGSENQRASRTSRRHIPEDDTLQNHRCENLKSYKHYLHEQYVTPGSLPAGDDFVDFWPQSEAVLSDLASGLCVSRCTAISSWAVVVFALRV